MDDWNDFVPQCYKTTLARKSWTAYVPLVVIGALLMAVAVPYARRYSPVAGTFVTALVVACAACAALAIRRQRLFIDEHGVWVRKGLLPWRRRVVGVSWRELDEAVFSPTAWSAFKSYSVRIRHRFLKSREIVVTHVAHGHEAVEHVNGVHQGLIRGNRLG